MGDATGGGDLRPADEDRIEALAQKLLRNPAENGLEPGDLATAKRQAARMLEDSEARVHDPAARDPEVDEVIRRSSSETSTTGETSHPRTSSGD